VCANSSIIAGEKRGRTMAGRKKEDQDQKAGRLLNTKTGKGQCRCVSATKGRRK